jgi:hypothetical protein
MIAFNPTSTFNKSVDKSTEPNIKLQKTGAEATVSPEASSRF